MSYNRVQTTPVDQECNWNIQVEPRMAIALTIEVLYARDNLDQMIIYDGTSQSDPNLMIIICRTNVDCNETFTDSKGEISMVRDISIRTRSDFSSDNSMEGKQVSTLSLRVYDGHSTHDKLLLTGNLMDTMDDGGIISSTNTVLIVFRHTNVSASCGQLYIKNQGYIHSPGYPLLYPNSILCEWTVRVPRNHTIIVQFIDFHTEESDYLTIISNSETYRYSGQHKPSNLLTSGNTMSLLFKTDGTIVERGFKIAYKAISLDPSLTFVIVADNALLRTHSSNTTLLAMNGDRMSGLMDYDSVGDRFVWFDHKKHNFILQSFNEKHVIPIGDGEPNSLAVDWIHDLLYWMDSNSNAIKVLSLGDKSKSIYTVHEIQAQSPKDLVLNVVTGALVWSNVGFEANIMQLNLDSDQPLVLYSSGRHAMHLTVDYGSKQYYFIDRTDHSLYSIDFWGKNETFIMKSVTLFDPIVSSLQVVGNDLYFNHEFFIYRVPDIQLGIERAHVVYKIHRVSGSFDDDHFFMTNTIDINRREFNTFKIVNQSHQPSVGLSGNPCDHSNCAKLCVPRTVATGQAYRLKRDLTRYTPELRLNPRMCLRDIDDNENCSSYQNLLANENTEISTKF
ncbi:unnamed protein product [Medioppia subpectinata]|uniref:CUB domain-containing protein n=1 Tax=Medioppia subpectinata TaxID=1979941 RepID=A0A7R9PWY6_9ACAR|nr:unnamed protein product [Medioppia subpectinata]CAG2104209.1 unnamed protein product [Medioppia subpectinata]